MAPQGQWAHCTVHLFPWFLLLIFGWLVLNMAAVLLHTLAGSSILASDPIQAAIRMGGGGGGGTSWSHWQWFHWELRSNKRSAEYHPWGATYPTGSPPTPRHCAPSPVDVPQTYPHHTATQAQLCCDCSPEWDVTRCSRTWADSWGLHSPVTFSSLAAAYPPIPSPHFLRKKKSLYLSLPDSSYLFSDCIWFVGIILNTAPLGTCNHPCLALCTYLFFLYVNSVPRHSQENFTGAEQQSQAQSISVLVRWGTASKALFEMHLFLPL